MQAMIKIDAETQELWQALNGYPFFIVVQDSFATKGLAAARVSRNFDYDHLFNVIKVIARTNKAFKEKLTDYIIDLSKEV